MVLKITAKFRAFGRTFGTVQEKVVLSFFSSAVERVVEKIIKKITGQSVDIPSELLEEALNREFGPRLLVDTRGIRIEIV